VPAEGARSARSEVRGVPEHLDALRMIEQGGVRVNGDKVSDKI
jgi:hypothetical protein